MSSDFPVKQMYSDESDRGRRRFGCEKWRWFRTAAVDPAIQPAGTGMPSRGEGSLRLCGINGRKPQPCFVTLANNSWQL